MSRVGVWIATLGPLGWWPFGPGTLTAALVTACWWWAAPSRLAIVVAAGALVVVGTLAAGSAERALGPDDGRIVIDEAAGMALALAGVPHGPAAAVLAFVSFRVLDIAKPPPVSWCERVRGGPGVMLDDVVAGLAAALIGAAAFAAWPPE
jgi:phosphatidylglycerophosphatase A